MYRFVCCVQEINVFRFCCVLAAFMTTTVGTRMTTGGKSSLVCLIYKRICTLQAIIFPELYQLLLLA